tara:strand:- start:1194 stop:2843 length:1650 start_codon:yes stop_codon:yes gene_type:complete
MKSLKPYLFTLILVLSSLSAPAGDIIRLEELTPVSKKTSGCNEGRIYKDDLGQKWFIKIPGYKAKPSHEYIVGKLLNLLDSSIFAKISLVEKHPEQIASKFLDGFTPYNKHQVKSAGELLEKENAQGIELVLVARNWLGIGDENRGNMGTIPGEGETLVFTRIDYDTAFHYDTYSLKDLNFKDKGIETLDEDAFIHALGLVADMPKALIEKSLSEIYTNIDLVGVDFEANKRFQLEDYLALRKEEFLLRRDALLANKEILEHLRAGNSKQARELYSNTGEDLQKIIQREWLLEHLVNTRWDYANLVEELPEILNNWKDIKDAHGHTPLHMAVEWNLINLTEAIIDTTTDLDAIEIEDDRGWTALHIAADKGFNQCASILLKCSKNALNKKTKKDESPLHLAAANNRQSTVCLLIDEGANIEAENASGNTPLLEASQEGAEKSAMVLLNKGANASKTNLKGQTALHLCAMSSAENLCKTLAKIDPKAPYAQDNDERTPLHIALLNENSSIALALVVEYGTISTCVQDNNGLTPVDIAEMLSIDLTTCQDD